MFSDQAILLDTAELEFAPTLVSNLAQLGLKPEDIGWILGSHEHFDHLGGLAEFQRQSDAQVIAARQAMASLSGEMDPRDPQYGMHDALDPPDVARTVQTGDTLTLGGTEFTAIETPGHTPGALSWQWESCDVRGEACEMIVYADSMSPVSRDDYRFSDHPEYVAEYRAGLERLAALDCDILLTPHPSASQMLKRAASGTFAGGMTCREYAEGVEKRLDARLAKEATGE